MSKDSDIDPGFFLQKLQEQFEAEPAASIQWETEFRSLGQWSSMQALIVLASFDWEYGITLSADELAGAQTVQDLFSLVVKKKIKTG